jgi:hypothetical protein
MLENSRHVCHTLTSCMHKEEMLTAAGTLAAR